METALKTPTPREQDVYETKDEVLNGLIKDDSEAFFTLLGVCASVLPMEVEGIPKKKLINLGFLTEHGVPPIVKETVQAVVNIQ